MEKMKLEYKRLKNEFDRDRQFKNLFDSNESVACGGVLSYEPFIASSEVLAKGPVYILDWVDREYGEIKINKDDISLYRSTLETMKLDIAKPAMSTLIGTLMMYYYKMKHREDTLIWFNSLTNDFELVKEAKNTSDSNQ